MNSLIQTTQRHRVQFRPTLFRCHAFGSAIRGSLIGSQSRFLRANPMSQQPKILSEETLPTSEAKWVTLKKITWQDDKGVQRFWESAQRTTRKATGIDAVAIFALIRSKTNAFPLSTIIIEQFRPPIGKFVVEFPAGLMDEGETPEQAALRELEEETGYIGEEVIDASSILSSDPGMTNATMKLVSVSVICDDQLGKPEQKLDDGESITLRVVELSKLNQTLKEYGSKENYIVDAKLAGFAFAYDLGRNPNYQ